MILPALPAAYSMNNTATEDNSISRTKLVGVVAGVAALLLVWFAPLAMEPRAQHALAISLFMVVFWITEAAPHAVTGLLGCWLFWALGVAEPHQAFGGFSSSEAPWFLLGALLIGIMVTESGLARRIAHTILAKVGSSFSNVLLAFLATNFLLTFMVPSGPPRVILLGTIVLGAVASFGMDQKSNVAKSLILAITFSATLNDKTILGSTPAILARSLIMEHGEVPVYWSQWLIAYLPLGIFNFFAIWWLMLKLYPPEKKELPGGKPFLRQQLKDLGPWSGSEKRAAAWVLVALALWSTDFIHHVSPAVVGMGVGLLAAVPVIGVLKLEDMKKLNFFIFIFMGTALSMALVLRESGAVAVLSDLMFRSISGWMGSIPEATVVLYWAAFAVHLLLASETSMISVSMPVIMDYATTTGLSPLALGLVWSFATGGKVFIYQSLVLIAGYSFGCYTAKDVFKIGLFFLIVQWLMLMLIVNFYWPILGIV